MTHKCERCGIDLPSASALCLRCYESCLYDCMLCHYRNQHGKLKQRSVYDDPSFVCDVCNGVGQFLDWPPNSYLE